VANSVHYFTPFSGRAVHQIVSANRFRGGTYGNGGAASVSSVCNAKRPPPTAARQRGLPPILNPFAVANARQCCARTTPPDARIDKIVGKRGHSVRNGSPATGEGAPQTVRVRDQRYACGWLTQRWRRSDREVSLSPIYRTGNKKRMLAPRSPCRECCAGASYCGRAPASAVDYRPRARDSFGRARRGEPNVTRNRADSLDALEPRYAVRHRVRRVGSVASPASPSAENHRTHV
jgi:hypothetical protein